jgi:hypothetical protein
MIRARELLFVSAATSVMLAGPIAAPVAAQTFDVYTPKARVLADATHPQKAYDDKWRASLASAVFEWCEDLRRRVPRNTPAEDRWVEDEIASRPELDFNDFDASSKREEQRDERLHNSIEWARYLWSQVFSGCSSTAKSISESVSKSHVDQALLWLDLVHFGNSREEIQRVAVILGLLPRNYSPLRKFAGDIDRNYIGSLDQLTYVIFKYALPPLLKGEN